MKPGNQIWFLLILTFIMSVNPGCRKQDKPALVEIDLLNPVQNALISLPDTVNISLKITGGPTPEYIAINIVNRNYTHLFETRFIHHPEKEVIYTEKMILPALQDTGSAPYYVMISASVNEDTQHDYVPIQLVNRPVTYRGFYLFASPSVDRTSVTFYDQMLEGSFCTEAGGRFLASEISKGYRKLFLLTDIPARLRAYALTDAEPVWSTGPIQPYPVYTDVWLDDDWIYAAMGNGQIVAYDVLNGQPKMVAERLTDSLPVKVSVTDETIIGFYKSRTGGKNSLVSFYKVSGVQKHRYPVDFEIIGFYTYVNPRKIVVFGHRRNESVIAVFDPDENSFENTFQTGSGQIMTACTAGAVHYFYATAHHLYAYNAELQEEVQLMELSDTPVDIRYEQQTNTLFILYPHHLALYLYPQMVEQPGLELDEEINGLEFFYAYE